MSQSILQKAEKHKIQYGTMEIDFLLFRKDRRNLQIHVYPDGRVEVEAPLLSKLEQILSKVQKRAKWIQKHKWEFSKLQPTIPAPVYVSGETLYYLGKQYRLKIIPSLKKSIELKDNRIKVQIPKKENTEENRKALVQNWYEQNANHIIDKRMKECLKSFSKIKDTPTWKVKKLKNKWGNCSKKGIITFHPELIAAPKPCIDYVIYHELCHLIEWNHGNKFYNLLTKVYPNWKKWKAYLDENIGVRIL